MRTVTITLVGAVALAAGLLLVKNQREELEQDRGATNRMAQSGERSEQLPDLSKLRELGI
jgi:hypothetical protein